jgi:putative transposase
MPRTSRVVLPGVPLHITQRGVDRGPTFLAPEDHAYYRCILRDSAVRAGCLVHAYVLMDNHIHLLITPTDVDAPARMVRSLGLRYVRYFNGRYRRTGTLWEGRFHSVVVESSEYFFACSRYIELNPVRAGMVTDPSQYLWSSFRQNALGHLDPLLTPRAEYEALGPDGERRCVAYRALFRSQLAVDELARIRAQVPGGPKLFSTPYQEIVATKAVADHRIAARGRSVLAADAVRS